MNRSTFENLSALRYQDREKHLAEIRRSVFMIADAGAAVRRSLRLHDDQLLVGGQAYPRESLKHIYLVGLGKASPAMLKAASDILGNAVHAGVAAVPRTSKEIPPQNVNYIPAGHPLPDSGSLQAATAAFHLLANTDTRDLVVVMISGGGSAMMELPNEGVELDDLIELTTLLLKSGAPIDEVNNVRKALSQIKAGGLARMAAPARTVALILSDVVGDRLSSIASGPTVLRKVRPEKAITILKSYAVWSSVPKGIQSALTHAQPQLKPTPRPKNTIIGSNRMVVEEAQRCAQKLGFKTRVLSFRMEGEAREVGARFAKQITRAASPSCLLMGGETTVTVRGTGSGGRNQELALSAAIALDGVSSVVIQSLGTDGVDGPTDAAGAIVTGATVQRARDEGFDPESCLNENDSYSLLNAVNGLIRTGPTGTNLNDLVIGLRYP